MPNSSMKGLQTQLRSFRTCFDKVHGFDCSLGCLRSFPCLQLTTEGEQREPWRLFAARLGSSSMSREDPDADGGARRARKTLRACKFRGRSA